MTIRRTWHNEKWWFAIVDVVNVLTDFWCALGGVRRHFCRFVVLEGFSEEFEAFVGADV